MKSTIVEFKVAMNHEDSLAKKFKHVTTKVEFPESCMDEVFKAATKSYVIAMQSQIRSHWDEFLKCDLPEVLNFGEVLYGKKAKVVVRSMTSEELQQESLKQAKDMTAEQLEEYIQKLRNA